MNRIITLSFTCLCISLAAGAQNYEHYFLSLEQVPNSLEILPAPPAFGSEFFKQDSLWYEWGKTQRSSVRGEQARRDAVLWNEALGLAFSEAFGMPLTKENTPEILTLIINMTQDAGDLSTRLAKKHYQRVRPFIYFNEHTCFPEDEEGLSGNGSYPSGHTAIGWAVSLVLAEINPARQNEILKRGYEIGESRVICGYHYRSDVDAARITASAVVARLHADKAFTAQLKKAKKEFIRLSSAR